MILEVTKVWQKIYLLSLLFLPPVHFFLPEDSKKELLKLIQGERAEQFYARITIGILVQYFFPDHEKML